jgi:hypothetical protein
MSDSRKTPAHVCIFHIRPRPIQSTQKYCLVNFSVYYQLPTNSEPRRISCNVKQWKIRLSLYDQLFTHLEHLLSQQQID